jgi:hypothetical protein
MSSFDDRQKAFENKFKHDEELRFKVESRAVRHFGQWAASKLGKKGPEAEKYADEVLEADFEKGGIHHVFKKVKKDLAATGVEMTEHHLENEYNTHLAEAKKHVMAA